MTLMKSFLKLPNLLKTACLLLFGCSIDVSDHTISPAHFLYTNSFETEAEIQDWEIQSDYIWKVDSFLGSFGKHSVLVFGGCFYPHFAKQFGPFDHPIKLNVSLISKVCGGILNYVALDNNPDCLLTKSIYIFSNEWQEYHFKEDLVVPSNTRFEISLSSQSGLVADYISIYEKE